MHQQALLSVGVAAVRCQAASHCLVCMHHSRHSLIEACRPALGLSGCFLEGPHLLCRVGTHCHHWVLPCPATWGCCCRCRQHACMQLCCSWGCCCCCCLRHVGSGCGVQLLPPRQSQTRSGPVQDMFRTGLSCRSPCLPAIKLDWNPAHAAVLSCRRGLCWVDCP